MQDRVQRRLAAILAADVVGYSRLMEEDEEATLSTLTAHRAQLIEPTIAKHRGDLVKTTGDGFLAQFGSVVDAVNCAIAVQAGMASRNTDISENRLFLLRIGVNLGDVIVQDGDIFGDGVNVAARLEGLAEPGGIAVSGIVYESIRNQLDVEFENLGPQKVKNISEPIQVYNVKCGAGDGMPASSVAKSSMAERPSIAVLPFNNMSLDAELEFFADGMVEDIITSLSWLTWLVVIARNSSFTYKGSAVDVRKVASELGVRYVLEGSIRNAGNRVRITGQLIDAATGAHIWADKFDGDLEDKFDLQDRITESVVGTIETKLRKAETERSKRKRPENHDAYDLYLSALPHLYTMKSDDNTIALVLLEQAIGLDPNFAPALASAAWCYEQRFVRGWPTARRGDLDEAVRLARAVIALDSDDPDAIGMAGFVLAMVARDYDAGLAAVQRALDFNPNAATVCWTAGWVNVMAGNAQDALAVFERARRLSPLDPQMHFILSGMGMAYLLLGKYDEASEIAKKSVGLYADFDVTHLVLASAHGYLGRLDDANIAISKLRSLARKATLSSFRRKIPFRDEKDLESVLRGFRKAGVAD